jgi:nucleoid-associated protein YgaU
MRPAGTKPVAVNVKTIRPAKDTPKAYTVVPADLKKVPANAVKSGAFNGPAALWGIARKNLGDGSKWTTIEEINGRKNTSNLKPGQVLKMP